jgi:hypothetical protein
MAYDKEKLKLRIIQILLILAWAYICIFYILKKAGIINTPLWLEVSPQIVALISGAAILFGFIEFFIKLKNLPESHEKLSNRVDRMAIGLTKVDKDVEFMKKDFERIDRRFDTVDDKLDKLCRCKNYKSAC